MGRRLNEFVVCQSGLILRLSQRVKAGLRDARAKGKRFGRPRAQVDAVRVAALRQDGLSWSQVCRTLNVSKGSAQRSVATIA
jgi:DNA invertase Pin-like site-specific DNA recombinase